MDDLKWEIGVLLACYAERAAKLDEHDFDGERRLKDLYAQAIMLNIKKGYGLLHPIDDFIEDVCGGGYNDWDGIGELLDADGNEIGDARCNFQLLREAKDNGAVYVAWYNK